MLQIKLKMLMGNIAYNKNFNEVLVEFIHNHKI